MTQASLSQRVQQRLDALGMSARKASLDAGLSSAFALNILNGKSQSPRSENLHKLAAVLGTTVDWLVSAQGPESLETNGHARADDSLQRAMEETAQRAGQLMPVLGEVAAGRWLEVEQHIDESRYEPAPITPDPRWRLEAQYGLVVRGTSLNKYATDGDTLHCLDIGLSGRLPANGELVIVEKIRDGGQLRERTAKAYHEGENQFVELRAYSDDPRWDEPIHVPHRVFSYNLEKGLSVEIVAIVLGAYRPTPKVPRR
ncbi:LexA family transcriptional regulator [Methylobacterium sp. E-046]|uniref:LexA family transcriptional regulator n=1 Tax=Methylobacterium sp. E-046 TaxID=2836576 RepID=UPI001FBA0DE5|nr:helix-turn-helix domain-containing protein [Methylobacterium sp. E-046]MCJ2102409.1 helix-turn-helix domain-containing protein [Methylobacterium sp. E-046]